MPGSTIRVSVSAKDDVVVLISKADVVEDLERSIKHIDIYVIVI